MTFEGKFSLKAYGDELIGDRISSQLRSRKQSYKQRSRVVEAWEPPVLDVKYNESKHTMDV